MPGTYARDALAPQLFTGVTLNAAGTDFSDPVWDADHVDPFDLVVTFGTVTSTTNSATMRVDVQASDDITFATGVVSIGSLFSSGTDANQSNSVRKLRTRGSPGKRYIRLQVVIGGTAPVYTGAVAHPRAAWDRWKESDTA